MVDIALDNIRVEFPDEQRGESVAGLDDVTLHVRSGELLVLVGPSGSGKSTVLRTIAGVERPDQGTVTIDGQVVNELAPGDRDVALVSQSITLLSHLTVEDNLGFALRLRKVPEGEASARVRAEARVLGLWSKLRRRPRELSSGERQKAALGRATTRNPRVFLFDEPLAALDAAERGRVRRQLKQLQRGMRITTIYVTHDQRDAMALGDRIAIMHRGRVVQIDEPMQLYASPVNLFVARFFGSPPLGLLEGTLRDDGSTAWIDAEGTAVRLHASQRAGVRDHTSGHRIALGLRAAAVRLDDGAPGDEWSRRLPVVVARVEPQGATTVVALRPPGSATGPSLLYSTVGPSHRIAPGDQVFATVDLRNSFLFDSDTGARII